jgi:hypothetical protein
LRLSGNRFGEFDFFEPFEGDLAGDADFVSMSRFFLNFSIVFIHDD